MTEMSYVVEGIRLGICVAGVSVALIYGIYELSKEFKKPTDQKAYDERKAYLIEKRERWEAYFKGDK